MQTPAEKHLVNQICHFICNNKNDATPCPILNIGAGRSLSIEKQLSCNGVEYICDRIDIEDCKVAYTTIRQSWLCSVEDMKPVASNEYPLVFANYVLEHVRDIHKAANEINRVLHPSGIFVTTISNPSAPEFIAARKTPVWFHKKIRQGDAWETIYAYKSVSELLNVFESKGFVTMDVRYWPFTQGHLYQYPVLGTLARWYDFMVSELHITRLMGDVCITFKKS